jgi:flagella basal body P-ring formation protein FlgA
MNRLTYIVILIAVTAFTSFAVSRAEVNICFKDSAMVNDTLIRVKDIASVTGLNDTFTQNIQNFVIGESAPAGYCRKVSTQEICTQLQKLIPNPLASQEDKLQLWLITYAKRVDNTYIDTKQHSFNKNRVKSILVKTNAQEYKVGDFEKEIFNYIADSVLWSKANYSINLRNKTDAWKCLKTDFSVSVFGLASRYPKGNINLSLNMRQGNRTYCIPVLCNVSVSAEVVMAKAVISRGTVLSAENCVLEKKDITRFGYEPFLSLSDIGSFVATRTIAKETIIHNKLITKRPVIIKDDQVFVISSQGPIRISVIMRAREDGAVGDRIWVENPESHKLLKTKVVGKGRVSLLAAI